MKKSAEGVVSKIIIGVVLTFMVAMLSGCSDSELEHVNTQLKKNLVSAKTNNALLQSKLNAAELNNKNFQKELTDLRENNKGLNISLAKSEVLFSQKHKAELEAERNKLDAEREKFKKEQQKIEKSAYESAEKNVGNKYIGGMIGVSILAVILLVLWFLMWKKNSNLISSQESVISSQESVIQELTKKLNMFDNTIEELKRKQQEGSKNQVVNAIDRSHARKKDLLDGLRGDGHGN